MNNTSHIVNGLFAVTLFIAWSAVAQERSSASERKRELHHETMDQQYLPNLFDNKKVSPPYEFGNNAAAKVTGSTIFTRQVNIDSAGQNIVGDAANEPSLAVNPVNPNQIAIGWRQFDNIASNFRQAGWSYSSNAGLTWTFPGKIEPGIFRSDPVLDFDTAGVFYYNSLSIDNLGNYVCKVFKSTDGGATWDTGINAAGGDKQWMAVDRTSGIGSGNIYTAWTPAYSSCFPDFFTRSTDGGNSFENCTQVNGDPALGTEAVGSGGEVYIVGLSNAQDSLVVAKSVNAQIPGSLITWTTSSVFMDGYISGNGINIAGLTGQANIEVDNSGGPGQSNVYVLASVSRSGVFDDGDVMFARSTDGGFTWSYPVRVNDDASFGNIQWFGTMSVAHNGRIDAVWLDTRDDLSGLDSSALYYSYSTDQGITWSSNEKVSELFDPHVGYPMQNKMGDYFDMISDSAGVHLAWSGTFNGEEDVYYSRIIPPVPTGISEDNIPCCISVYPNPSKGKFVISGCPYHSTIKIYTTLGREVHSITSIQSITEINILDQPAGIYFLKIKSREGKTVVYKINKL